MILIHSIGQNDVQIVDPENQRRWPIDKNSVQAFTQFLAEHSDRWQITERLPEEFRAPVEWKAAEETLASPLSHTHDQAIEIDMGEHVATRPLVCCPLLEKFLARVGETHPGQEISAVLSLDTKRTGRPDEPTYAFEVLRRSLIERHEIKPDKIHQVTFLTEGTIERLDQFGQTVVRNDCAKIIDDSFLKVRKQIQPTPGAPNQTKVFINDSGGMPIVKPVIRSSARLRFGVNLVSLLPVQPKTYPEASDSDDKPKTIPDQISPSDSLEDRRRTWDALVNGDFVGAARIAQSASGESGQYIEGTHLRMTRHVQLEPWRKIVIAADRCTSGDFQALRILPQGSKTRKALEQIQKYGFVALAGIRVENALRRNHFEEAIVATDCFYEVCEKDPHIVASRVENGTTLKDAQKRERLAKTLFDYWHKFDVALISDLMETDEELLRRMKKQEPPIDSITFRLIRNVISHHRVMSELVDVAIAIAQSREKPKWAFWNLSTKSKFKFLETPLIAPFCTAKKEGQTVANLLDGLLYAIESDMDKFAFRD